ncbi:MAG TPA: DMT family transporter [Crenalkalicoccus sp.]|nr:DMT family transporter [Crenalkalicoccus sp.]
MPAKGAVERRRAVLLVLGAAAFWSLAAGCVKALGGALPLAEVIFCRNLFCIPVLLPVLWRAGGLAALRTRNPAMHALRTASGLMGMVGAFYGYGTLPLALVTALGFTMPLFLTLLSIPVLGERVGPRRAAAVAVGFAGVVLIAGPGGMPGGQLPAMAMVLMGALGWAISMISIRLMGDAGEKGVAIVLWFAIGAAAVSGLAALPVWVAPTPGQWALLIGTGLISAFGQLLMTEAYRRGEATLNAPFEYSAILWTTAIGAIGWAELPDGWDVVGMLVLVGSGLYIWRRELVLRVRR